jgi:FlaA1/EpsC-like NDP-sugar epimerase
LETVTERRLEALKLEGMGLSQPDIVKQISEKFQVSAKSIYRDFQLRDQWQPILLQLKDRDKVMQKIINRYEQIYERAAFKHVTSQNENVQVGALKIMLDTNSRICEAVVLSDVVGRLKMLEAETKKGVFVK